MVDETRAPVVPENLEEILRDLGYGIEQLNDLLTVIHPADLAMLLEGLDPRDRVQFFHLMDNERAADGRECGCEEEGEGGSKAARHGRSPWAPTTCG